MLRGTVSSVFNSPLRYRRLFGMLGLSILVLVLGSQASGRAAEGPYPGLPRHALLGGSWAGVAQGGISEAAKARQWAQVPFQVVAAYSAVRTTNYEQDLEGRTFSSVFTIYAYLVSPAGAEHNYGISPKFTVRTVAFGAIPVEATLQLIQRRNADGLPVPIMASTMDTRYSDLSNIRADTVVEDVVTLRVTRLMVDGVDLGLGSRCQTAEPGKLSLLGKGGKLGTFQMDEVRPWLSGHYGAAAGGLLAGKLDVPDFTGCLTPGGEDVSRLLTSAVSGRDNPVRLNLTAPNCGGGLNLPPAPGITTPEAAACQGDQMPPQIPIP